jgi:2-polyprenyl-6-methoxyphenol hydroxylase-like FAD-dependent oxidoreductase
VEESWSYPGKVKDILAYIEGWDPVLRTAISKIPEEVIVDFKLLWRDPIKKWVSDNRRVVILGDAAHPHLPTSASGATQALEDAAALAALVEKAGKANLPTALMAFEKLR